jgi:hypothetical protein
LAGRQELAAGSFPDSLSPPQQNLSRLPLFFAPRQHELGHCPFFKTARNIAPPMSDLSCPAMMYASKKMATGGLEKVVRKLAVLLVLLVPFSMASASKRFEAPLGDVFSAAVKSIESRGVVLTADRKAKTIVFVSGRFQGTAVLTDVGTSTDVVIETQPARVQGATTVHDAMWGSSHSPANQVLDDMGKVLEGKPLKPNERLQRQSREVAAKLRPTNPATVLIRGTKEEVKSALVAECAARGLPIMSETDHQITVGKEAANFNLISELLIGNYSIRGYRATVQFMLASEADGIRVTPIAEVMARNGFGATYSTTVTNEPDAIIALQAMLDAVKQRAERQKAP